MAEKTSLKTMKCPTCGASLKAENNTDTITCVYCGNSIVPVTTSTAAPQNETVAGAMNYIKVEGIKTSSSALAYIEQFFEEYDWDAFAYAQTLSVSEIDKLAQSLKMSSADDKNTWFVCFKALYVPFVHKISGCRKLLESVIEEYKQDNFDAYSKFDAYKRISAMIMSNKKNIVASLEKIAENAGKYGASPTEVSGLASEIETIKNAAPVELYDDIEGIAEIRSFIREKNARIVAKLASEGIDAESEYERAKSLIDEKKYVEALNILNLLAGYADTDELIDKIDRYYLISDVLEIEGKLYYFQKGSSEYETALSLCSTENGEICEKPIIKNIFQIVSNYADILYYIGSGNKLKKYNLSTRKKETVYKGELNKERIYSFNERIILIAPRSQEYNNPTIDIIELNVPTGNVRTIVENARDLVSVSDNMIIYKVAKKTKGTGYETEYEILTQSIDVDTGFVRDLGENDMSVVGYVGDSVVYTVESPDASNKNLYIKSLVSDEPAVLIEKNIYRFCGVIADKLFYYVGNRTNQSLININCDGTDRRGLPLFISEVLFEQSGWVYFIRRVGYNSILGKSRLDGSRFSVIAADVDRFIEIKNGYLYYVNSNSSLMKVRMDGSNLQQLCDDVERILLVREDMIVFVSVDERIRSEFTQTVIKTVKSIYAVNFSGGGKMKLAYDIVHAEKYDDNTIYYISEKKKMTGENAEVKTNDVLYKLDVNTLELDTLLNIKPIEKKGCYVATCVYGSYDCPEVWTLRRFRDDILAASVFGRAFIRTYYAISPTLVEWFGNTEWFKKMWKGTLDRMVKNLQNKGVADTPYEDKNW